ncbi:Trafficking protein particle complex 8 [Perkinsus chesapeaki]|uniref:Trafficking protein particle complex 8 n=1 Tax=Perkinsus chesapeaki TaxID=330153 RepID=A0A7J6MJF6_PERCH|nr:Trafficking protein particle complex 8 [Perkinsus chesapeaki]
MTHAIGSIDADSEQWCQDVAFSATAVVVATEQAKEVVWQAHKMTIPQLLQPFGGYYTPVTVQVRTGGRARQIEGFRLRFISTEDASEVPESIAQDRAAEAFATCMPQQEESQTFSSATPPRFDAWLGSEAASLAFSDHECISQPLATVLVASTSSLEPSLDGSQETVDPVQAFEQLMHEANMPTLARRGILDPDAARMKVLIHDPARAPPGVDLDALVDRMRSTYSPQSCFLLVIGDGPTALPDVKALFQRDPFASSIIDDDIAVGIEWTEVDELQRLGTAIVCQCAAPWAERKLAELDDNISLKRKGFRNAFSRFLRKPNLPGTEAIGGPVGDSRGQNVQSRPGASNTYTLANLEWQIRLAGDLAFHLRDYSQAVAYYRQVTPDFKQDHQWGVAAGAYEMSAVAAWLEQISTGGDGGVPLTEISRFVDNAIDLYKKAGPRYYRHAIRAAVIQSAILRGHVESPQKLLKVNGDIPDAGLRCALLLERSARLQRDAGQVRKMCFHLVLAGHTYNKAGYKQWALACYKAVVPEYVGKGWTHITDHLLFTMAKQTFALGDATKSIHYFTDLFNSITLQKDTRSPISISKQHNYLKGFLYVLRSQYGKEVADVPPADRVQVILPRVRLGSIGTNVGEALEMLGPRGTDSDLNTSDAISFTNRPVETELESWGAICGLGPDVDKAPADDTDVILVGQTTSTVLTVANPLQIPVELTDLRLVFEDSKLVDSSVAEPIKLDGDQFMSVKFSITPRGTGRVVLTGAQWVLDHTAPCVWTCPKEGRPSITVVDSMPLIRATLPGLRGEAAELLDGELKRPIITLTNVGTETIDKVEWFYSHQDKAIAISSQGREASARPLEVGASIEVPFTIRGHHVGHHRVRIAARGTGCSGRLTWTCLERDVFVHPGVQVKLAGVGAPKTGPRRSIQVPIRCIVTNSSPSSPITLDKTGPLDVYPSSGLGALQVEEALPIDAESLGPGKCMQIINWVTLGGDYSSMASEGGDFLLNEAKAAHDLSATKKTKTFGGLGLHMPPTLRKACSRQQPSEHYHIVLNWTIPETNRCGQSFCPNVSLSHSNRADQQPVTDERRRPLDSSTLKTLTGLV